MLNGDAETIARLNDLRDADHHWCRSTGRSSSPKSSTETRLGLMSIVGNPTFRGSYNTLVKASNIRLGILRMAYVYAHRCKVSGKLPTLSLTFFRRAYRIDSPERWHARSHCYQYYCSRRYTMRVDLAWICTILAVRVYNARRTVQVGQVMPQL